MPRPSLIAEVPVTLADPPWVHPENHSPFQGPLPVTLLTHWEGEPVGVWQDVWAVPALEVHQRLGSTNDRAGELAREGAPPFTTVLAEEQSLGRGRGGKSWHSLPGTGLWLSTLLRQDGPVALALPLLVGLAAARAIEATQLPLQVGIKWPNDLILAHRKIGGILCEATAGTAPTETVVVGVGLNLREPVKGFPSDIAATAGSLEGISGESVRRSDVATRLMSELHRLLDEPANRLTGDLHDEFAARDVLAGRKVTTAHGNGVARGIDETGALKLERGDGSHLRVIAGSVELARGTP